MENILTSLIPYIPETAIPLVFCVALYLIIKGQRERTAKTRDEKNALLEYRVDKLEESNTSLSKSIGELQQSIVNLQISVNTLITEIKNLKEVK